MTSQKTNPKHISDQEKRKALDAVFRKFASRLGLDPTLYDSTIVLGLRGNLSPEREHELAKMMGIQLLSNAAKEQLMPGIHTQEDLDNAVQALEADLERAPTVARKEIDRIKRGIPRMGGPGRKPKLNGDEKAQICDAIMRHIRDDGMGITEAIEKTVDECPELVQKKIGKRTLEEAWSERKRFPARNTGAVTGSS